MSNIKIHFMKPDKERRKINGEWIKALRKEMGLSQTEFATRLDVSLPSVSRWELNVFRPTKLAANALLLLAATFRAAKSSSLKK